MTPSLPNLPITGAGPSRQAGAPTENVQNQSDKASSGDFSEVLGVVHQDLAPASQAANQAAQAEPDERQPLPPDGKLLPQLQQTVERLADAGIDPKQFIEQLNARLKTLAASHPQQAPAELLATALQQLIQEQPALKSALPSELQAFVAAAGTAGQALLGAGKSAGTDLSGDADARGGQPRPTLIAKAIGTVQAEKALPDATAKAAPSNNLLTQLSQQTAATDSPQSDLAVLVAALKRMTADTRPAAAGTDSSSLRTDLPGAAVSGSPPIVTHAAAATPSVTLNAPLGQAGWDQALGERIQWLAGQKTQSAQIKLNPANLGPMEVRIQVHNDQATVQFTAHHAVVREALESALPRLRDMLEASGVELVNVDVSSGQSHAEQQAASDPPKPYRNSGNGGVETGDEIALVTPLTGMVARGYLDLFA